MSINTYVTSLVSTVKGWFLLKFTSKKKTSKNRLQSLALYGFDL
jgi:hypothetical protein